LDKLIAEVLGLKEDIAPETKGKADIETTGGEDGGLGLDIGEILKILQVGSESERTIKSSKDSIAILTKAIAPMRYGSASEIVEYFKQFDIVADKTMNDPCTSLGGLMSKYALAAGLVSIFEQFNGSAGGFIGENLVAQFFGGNAKTIPVGDGGIEDIVVGNIGINLKVKTSKHVHGSMTQLLETLGISYTAKWYKDEKYGHYMIPMGGKEPKPYTAIVHTPYVTEIDYGKAETDSKGRPLPIDKKKSHGATVTVHSKAKFDKLYYLFLEKTGGKEKDGKKGSRGLTVWCAELDPKKIQGHGNTTNLEKMNNVIAGSIKQLIELGTQDGKVKAGANIQGIQWARYTFETKFDVEHMNAALDNSAKEVMESMRRLNAWYGALQTQIMQYVSSLDFKSYNDLQTKLDEAEQWSFEAFKKQC
jgi:hypothetical protein